MATRGDAPGRRLGAPCRGSTGVRPPGGHDGSTDEQRWAVAGPLLDRVLDAGRFPRAARGTCSAAGTAHGSAHDPEHAFAFGLRCVPDGLAVLVEDGAGGR